MSVDAQMTPEELNHWFRLTGLTRSDFAHRLGISLAEFKGMETGRVSIPARFDDDVPFLVDEVIFAMDDPSPGEPEDPGD